jgi:hypothetical protein
VTAPVVVRDARPPVALVRCMNPVMRALLRTPFGRAVRPFALLEFQGRRTARRMRVPVGWHEVDDGAVVFSPARWRVNFRGGAPVTVHFRGRRRQLIGVLEEDPERVAAALRALVVRRGSLRPVGVDVPAGHRVNADDVVAVDRAMIRFELPAS